MYCSFEGKFVTVRETSGRLVRKFSMNANVISAQMSGDNVVIQCEDGWTYVYGTDNRFIRKTKSR